MNGRLIILFIFLNFLPNSIQAQPNICSGSLGENIFLNGDFGSGQTNIPPKPERIISTYNYVLSGPPRDGDFTITNNTGAWTNLYATWLATRDSSEDPNGYFMVVNADFETGIFYEETIDDLCENTVYTFYADILNLVKSGTLNHNLPNVTFLLNDEERYTTGEILQDERWNRYGFTFVTKAGDTSMKLSLRNNAPGGTGNDLAIDNLTFRPCGPVIEILPKDVANICEDGDPIEINATIDGNSFGTSMLQWQQSFDEGITWKNIESTALNSIEHTEKKSGAYYYRFLLANSAENLNNPKCRVNSNTKIVQVIPKFWDITKTICVGKSFPLGNKNYSQTGVYRDSLISSIGCDSIVTLDLTVKKDDPIRPVILSEDPICAGDNNGVIDIPNIKNVNAPFEIQMEGRTASSLVRFVALNAGNYAISITDAIGCTFDTLVTLSDPKPFILDLGGNITIDLGESVELSAIANFPISEYQWFFQQSENCIGDCSNQTLTPTLSDTYRLSATTELGCVATDSIFIQVNPVRKVFIPNVFSPNGDGINDFFSIYTQQPNVQKIMEVAIFDRWGNQVFLQQNQEGIAVNDYWDGQYKGQLVERGAYLYYAKILFLDGVEEVLSGTISVVY